MRSNGADDLVRNWSGYKSPKLQATNAVPSPEKQIAGKCF